MGLIQDLGAGPIALDSSCFIYFIEDHPRFSALIEPVFTAIDVGRLQAVTSVLTLLEVLVVPYRSGNETLAKSYEAILSHSRGLKVLPIDQSALRGAALLRARHSSLRTPDALQLAAALAGRCTSFLTNDRALPTLPGLRVLQLSAYA